MHRFSTARRLHLSIITAGLVAAIVAAGCGSDATSPTTPTGPTGTAPNGTTIAADSGVDLQTAVAGTPILISVHVKTASGAGLPGDTVKWNIAVGGGTLSSPTSITDANGLATVTWTLGKVVGMNTIGVNIPGAAVAISATGVVGPFAALVKISPDSQTVVSTGSVLLTVQATDQFGNFVDSIPVRWSASGGTVAPGSSMTGTRGNSQATFTTPAGVSRYTVTAGTAGVAALTFIVKTF